MQAPPPTADETGRLAALQRYKILETPPDGFLDDLTRLAAYVCQAPIAYVVVVDRDREWFRSRVGLALADIPRVIGFSVDTLHAADLHIVEDARLDARVADHPLVSAGPRIRFYAGAPLRTADGHAIAILAVADTVPRQLTKEQLDALRTLGRQAMAQLELRRQTLELAQTEARAVVGEERIRHLNRVHAVRSHINQAIVRQPHLDRLLDEACRVAVETGGFRMAWLGLIDPGTERLVRRAQAGADAATQAIIDALIAAEPPAGCAFTARALASGQPDTCEDVERDPEAESWRQAALERGYRSMAAFPIVANGRAIGAFNIYADRAVAFDLEERRLLSELAGDIGFAIGTHERERERQRAEVERRAAEDRFRQLAETIQQVFWMSDAHGVLLYVSPAFETIFGRPCASVAASPGLWMDAVHPDDRERVEQAAYARLRRGDYDEVYRIVRPDGAVRWIRDRAFHVYDDAGAVHRLVGTAADITEQRQLEEQLQQAQKMEIIGRLAGGVAHDFNNLLTVINGMADLVLGGLADNDPARPDLVQIRQAGDRAAALTGRLLAVSRRQILKPEVLDLSAVIGGLRDMLQRLVGEDVVLELALAPDLVTVKADPGQIEQVVLNLVVNARDAMPDGGTLTIESRNVQLDATHAADHPGTRPGPHAMLTVRDTGVGMDDAVRRRIFEPFFTTKPQGKGTGLGLSMVYGIVKQSGGSIWFDSAPGRGTRFTLYLPQVFGAPVARPAPLPTVTAHGHETVLVVEDEPPLRELAARILVAAGYTVLKAANGPDALAVIARHPDPVHLVFTDVVMPGMNGRELVARLSVLRPAMRVLYTSGYTEDAILRHGVLDDPRRFLSKPYTPAVLRHRIREALDG
jgi:two-component system, cell cycle sensor histidine kinase and response regulator CckA